MGHFPMSKHKRHGLQILYSEKPTLRDAGEIKTLSDKGLGLASRPILIGIALKIIFFPNRKKWCKKESLEHPVKEKRKEEAETWSPL